MFGNDRRRDRHGPRPGRRGDGGRFPNDARLDARQRKRGRDDLQGDHGDPHQHAAPMSSMRGSNLGANPAPPSNKRSRMDGQHYAKAPPGAAGRIGPPFPEGDQGPPPGPGRSGPFSSPGPPGPPSGMKGGRGPWGGKGPSFNMGSKSPGRFGGRSGRGGPGGRGMYGGRGGGRFGPGAPFAAAGRGSPSAGGPGGGRGPGGQDRHPQDRPQTLPLPPPRVLDPAVLERRRVATAAVLKRQLRQYMVRCSAKSVVCKVSEDLAGARLYGLYGRLLEGEESASALSNGEAGALQPPQTRPSQLAMVFGPPESLLTGQHALLDRGDAFVQCLQLIDPARQEAVELASLQGSFLLDKQLLVGLVGVQSAF